MVDLIGETAFGSFSHGSPTTGETLVPIARNLEGLTNQRLCADDTLSRVMGIALFTASVPLTEEVPHHTVVGAHAIEQHDDDQ